MALQPNQTKVHDKAICIGPECQSHMAEQSQQKGRDNKLRVQRPQAQYLPCIMICSRRREVMTKQNKGATAGTTNKARVYLTEASGASGLDLFFTFTIKSVQC